MDFNKIVKDRKCIFEVKFDDGTGHVVLQWLVKGVDNFGDLYECWDIILSRASNLAKYAGFNLLEVKLLQVNEWEVQ